MSNQEAKTASSLPAERNFLFIASSIALITTAMTFAIRAGLLGQLGTEMNLSPSDMGWVAGTAFWGFTLSMIFGGFLVDTLGMGFLLLLAFVGHVAGIALTIYASGFWSLYISTLLVGIGNGMVEAACNPLIATLYPDQKTKMLNRFHIWFPGGIVIGGLVSYFLTKNGFGWQIQMASILVPAVLYGILFFGKKLPKTERVTSGISQGEMLQACFNPYFLFMLICMLMTSATELGTNQWIGELLQNAGVSSILLLVFINGIMAIGRGLAGELVHRIAPQGMLLFSAIFSFLGLLALSVSTGAAAFVSAGIFAIGICYFWPTMLGFVAEKLPKTGALGLSLMGGMGMLSVSLILPFMGSLYDAQTAAAIPSDKTLEVLKSAQEGTADALIWAQAKLQGGAKTLRYVSVLPLILTVLFGYLVFKLKKNPEIQ